MSYLFSDQTKQAQNVSLQSQRIQSSTTQPNGLEDHVLNAAIGYKQGTSQPWTTDKQRAMRILTRKGQVLDGNPYQLPNITSASMPRAKNDFEVVYRSDTLEAIRDEASPDLGQQPPYINNEAMARLEAGQLFQAEDGWEDVNVHKDQIPVSRFSPYDSPPKKSNLFRSISKKVAGALFGREAPKRPEISAPLRDLRHEPGGEAGIPRAVKYAIPILTPAAELANRADHVQEAIELRQLKKPGERPKLSVAGLQKHQQRVAPEVETRKVKVVGSPDRMTELGDFMNLRDSMSEDYVGADEVYARQRRLLEARADAVFPPTSPGEAPPGSPDRMAELGDSMDIRELPFSGDEPDRTSDDDYDRERRILQARGLQSFRLSRDSWMPARFLAEAALSSSGRSGISMDSFDSGIEYHDLGNGMRSHERMIRGADFKRPVRKPSKRVDTSRYSWTPPAQSSGPRPQPTGESYVHISAGSPATESLVGRIDQHLAEMDIAEDRLSFDSKDDSSPRRVNRATSLDMLGLGGAGEDGEREIMVDTFIQGNQVVWRAGERDGAKRTRKAQVAFLTERATRRAEDSVDDATLLSKRLEALRKLEAENI